MSRKMMLVTFMVLPFLAARPVLAQDTLKLDLGKALEIALSENPTVKVADKEIQKKKYARKGSYASIIRKTKCFDFWERNVLFPKTKRSFFRTPKHPLPCPFPLNFSLLIITKKFGNLAKNRYICIV